MTSLYYDTNIGCTETFEHEWTREDEGYVSLFSRMKKLFH